MKNQIKSIEDVLVALAQRINKNDQEWWGDLSASGLWTCAICKETLMLFPGDYHPVLSLYSNAFNNKLIKHGIQHLREHNLLMFL